MSEAEAGAHTEGVRRYYDDNSARFERHGQGGASIHRAVWGPGVASRAAAFHHVDELILQSLRGLGLAPRVVDLGCRPGRPAGSSASGPAGGWARSSPPDDSASLPPASPPCATWT